jgi:hypothetical protein
MSGHISSWDAEHWGSCEVFLGGGTAGRHPVLGSRVNCGDSIMSSVLWDTG